MRFNDGLVEKMGIVYSEDLFDHINPTDFIKVKKN